MPKYKKGDEKEYFPKLIAILIVIAIAIGTFIVSLITGGEKQVLEDAFIEKSDEGVNPTAAGPFPKSQPNVAAPGYPPPKGP